MKGMKYQYKAKPPTRAPRTTAFFLELTAGLILLPPNNYSLFPSIPDDIPSTYDCQLITNVHNREFFNHPIFMLIPTLAAINYLLGAVKLDEWQVAQ